MRYKGTYRAARRNACRAQRGVWHRDGVHLDPVHYQSTDFYSGDMPELTDRMKASGQRFIRNVDRFV